VRWTAEPFAVTVQLPPAVNVTSRPEDAVALTGKSAAPMALSARGYHRVLRVARTLADLDAKDRPSRLHIAEALSYRQRQGLVRQAA